MSSTCIQRDGHYIVYDQGSIEGEPWSWFDADYWRAKDALIGETIGRGVTYFVQDSARQLVLRHYRRGGLVAKMVHDHYLWTGLDGTRAWREWHLLASLHSAGLPVPKPIAARVIKRGSTYTADIIVERIEESLPLAEVLAVQALPLDRWREIGRVIHQLHTAGVCHPDLNARNILIGHTDGVYLIDFDKSAQRKNCYWQKGNLARLERSLRKFTAMDVSFHFEESGWQALLAGYVNASGSRSSDTSSSR